MNTPAQFSEARREFHATLLEKILTINSKGVVSNADSSNRTSIAIAGGIAELLKAETTAERMAGQTSGNQFEGICADFVRQTFTKLGHLRPGQWDVHQVTGRNRLEIAKYEQYSHLVALDRAAKNDSELAAALGRSGGLHRRSKLLRPQPLLPMQLPVRCLSRWLGGGRVEAGVKGVSLGSARYLWCWQTPVLT